METFIHGENYDPNAPTIICIPDIKESPLFLEESYRLELNLVIVIKEKWRKTTDIRKAVAVFIAQDFEDTRSVAKSIREGLAGLNRLKIDSLV